MHLKTWESSGAAAVAAAAVLNRLVTRAAAAAAAAAAIESWVFPALFTFTAYLFIATIGGNWGNWFNNNDICTIQADEVERKKVRLYVFINYEKTAATCV